MRHENLARLSVVLILFSIYSSGCIKHAQQAARAVFPVHDEALIFEHSFDYTYLRITDAILSTDNWSLYETNKREGLIRAYNEKFMDPFAPLGQRVATFHIKSLSRTRTALEVDPVSQTLIGLEDLLQSIKEHINR